MRTIRMRRIELVNAQYSSPPCGYVLSCRAPPRTRSKNDHIERFGHSLKDPSRLEYRCHKSALIAIQITLPCHRGRPMNSSATWNDGSPARKSDSIAGGSPDEGSVLYRKWITCILGEIHHDVFSLGVFAKSFQTSLTTDPTAPIAAERRRW
jgi:hypothetical protein